MPPNPRRGAAELLALGALGAIWAAFLPWEYTGDVVYQRRLATGVELGWGLLVAAIGVALLVALWRNDWRVPAGAAAAAGLVLVGFPHAIDPLMAAVPAPPRADAVAVGPLAVPVDLIAVPRMVDFVGLVVLVATVVAVTTDRAGAVLGSIDRPRPLAGARPYGQPIERRTIHRLAVLGTVGLLATVLLADLFARLEAGLALGYPVFLFYPAVVVVLLATRLWSAPVAVLAVLGGSFTVGGIAYGYATAPGVVPSWLARYPLGGGLPLVFGSALLAAGVLELGGAGRGGSDDVRSAVDGPAGEGQRA